MTGTSISSAMASAADKGNSRRWWSRPNAPSAGEAQGLAQIGQVGIGVFGRARDRAEEQGVVLGQHLVRPHGDGRASLEAVSELPSVLVVGGAELQVVMRLDVVREALQRMTEFSAAFRSRTCRRRG